MRIFLTGGSGFVGGHLIENLVPDHDVVALARSEGSAQAVSAFGATAVHGSLEDVDASLLDGVDLVIHAAAFVSEFGTRAQFEAANVLGTQRLLDAARTAGVSRFLVISTEAVLFAGTALVDIDETVPYPRRTPFLYSETKARAEALVLEANADGFTTLSLRPSFVWGPRDTTVLPGLRRMVEAGSFAWLDGGRHLHSTTHVANLVSAVRAALTAGRGGEAYFIADERVLSMRAFLTELAESDGLKLPDRTIPGWLARAGAWTMDFAYRTLGLSSNPPLSRFAVALMSRQVTVRTDKAQSELGWSPFRGPLNARSLP